MTLQLLNMDRLDEAWEAINKATQRYPLLPRLWLDQASVARARGDDAEERRALETACQINPHWGWRYVPCAVTHERHGDLKASRQPLEQLAAFTPLDAANQVMLAETLWRWAKRKPPWNGSATLSALQPGYERAWECLNRWTREMNCRDVALETALALTQQRGGEARSWLVAAQAYDLPDEHDRRLAALDKALELNPECVDAFDLRARSLAAASRWEEAYAACRPTVFGEKPAGGTAGPRGLDCRPAGRPQAGDRRDEAGRGQVAGHVRRLVEPPSMVRSMPRTRKGSLEAAEAMVRIAPQYEFSYGCLGEARAMSANRAGAIEAYRRALEMNPKYEFAGNALFDLHMEENDLKSAAATLAILRKHVQTGYVLARAVQLAVRQRNLSGLRGPPPGLRDRVLQPWPVDAAADAMVKAGWVERCPRDPARGGRSRRRPCPRSPVVGHGGAHAGDDRGLSNGSGPQRKMAGAPIMPSTPISKPWPRPAKAGVFDRFVADNRPWLRDSAFTWGSVGYGMAILRQYRAGRCLDGRLARSGPTPNPGCSSMPRKAFWATATTRKWRPFALMPLRCPIRPPTTCTAFCWRPLP